jgi:serine/threonine protein kinase
MNIDNNTANSDVRKFYDKERTTLELMRKLDDPHLIKAIASYTKGTSRCFIFPWAQGGNLEEFWGSDRSRLDRDLVRWAIDQFTGITKGIMRLHQRNTRHGDIKPLNILYFLDSVDRHGRGILKVADVGLAKVHTEYTRYRIATTTRMSSERYEPPEMPLYLRRIAAVPRVYDTWSLGCVLFEFVIWLIYGQPKIDEFHEDLKNTDSNKFWETEGNSPRRHRVVDKLIKQMEAKVKKTTAIGALIRLISSHLLVPADQRLDSKQLYLKLKAINDKCREDASYFFDASLANLAKNRRSPNDQTNGSSKSVPDKVSPLAYRMLPEFD